MENATNNTVEGDIRKTSPEIEIDDERPQITSETPQLDLHDVFDKWKDGEWTVDIARTSRKPLEDITGQVKRKLKLKMGA